MKKQKIWQNFVKHNLSQKNVGHLQFPPYFIFKATKTDTNQVKSKIILNTKSINNVKLFLIRNMKNLRRTIRHESRNQ